MKKSKTVASSKIADMLHEMDAAWCKACLTKSPADLQFLHQLQNRCHYYSKMPNRLFYVSALSGSKGNPAKFWKSNHYHTMLLHPYPVKLFKALPPSQTKSVYVMCSMHILFPHVTYLKMQDLLPITLIILHLARPTNLELRPFH